MGGRARAARRMRLRSPQQSNPTVGRNPNVKEDISICGKYISLCGHRMTKDVYEYSKVSFLHSAGNRPDDSLVLIIKVTLFPQVRERPLV